MRIRQLTVAGFRGFNKPRTIDFHDRLTVLSAGNSHGKTSITEALEFLLYGQTSKVEFADSRDEYKDSYINRHYSYEQPAFVEAIFDNVGSLTTLRVEVGADGTRRRLLNGQSVESWPFEDGIAGAARPFVVQHALKALLLAAPTDRFQGFARLLGLSEVDAVQQALVNLCTKPEAHVPTEVKTLLNDLGIFTQRLKAISTTAAIAREFDRGSSSMESAYARLLQRANTLTARQDSEAKAYDGMIALRNAAAAKVFKGSVAIRQLDSQEQKRAIATRDAISTAIDASFLESYSRLVQGDTTDRLRQLAKLLALGLCAAGDGSHLICAVAAPLYLGRARRFCRRRGPWCLDDT
ncbi:MAG: ATP-binding protein [Candidatus Nanopelagicales bacterium]